MPEVKERAAEDSARTDKLDKILSGIDNVVTRMDSNEERLSEIEKRVKEDGKKSDATAEEPVAAEKKDDAKRKDEDKAYEGKENKEEEFEELKAILGDKKVADAIRKFGDAMKSGRNDEDGAGEEGSNSDPRSDTKKKTVSEGFMEGGTFHPIRASAGYSSRKAGDSEEEDKSINVNDPAAVAGMAKEIAELRARLPKSLTDTDYGEMAGIHAKADGVYSQFGERAPAFSQGHTPTSYRKQCASDLAKKTDRFKGLNLFAMADDAFAAIEPMIYADAETAAQSPSHLPAGQIRPVSRVDAAGHRITEYIGSDMSAFLAPFIRPPIRSTRNIGKNAN
jgi:hypothetical protein